MTTRKSFSENTHENSISKDAKFGVDCTISFGVVIPSEVTIGDRVYIGANTVFVANLGSDEIEGTSIGDDAIIGASVVIYSSIDIARDAEIRPGAVVTRSVPNGAIVEGNPAYIIGYKNTKIQDNLDAQKNKENLLPIEKLSVKGVQIYNFPIISDLRGNLTVGEFEKQIPFTPLRYFMVHGVPRREVRGEHAHHQCQQFLICVNGSCKVVVDDGSRRAEILLDTPSRGLYLPPLIWGIQYQYSKDAVLLVFASHYYEKNDYIRDYEVFLKLKK